MKKAFLLPQTPSPSEFPSLMKGSVNVQYKRCGRVCHCRSGRKVDAHRQFYLFWWEGGRLKKQYVRNTDVEQVRAACDLGRQVRQSQCSRTKAARRAWSAIRDAVREIEKGV